MRQTTEMHCEKCNAVVLDIGSREDGELGWEYCPNCNNPRIEDEVQVHMQAKEELIHTGASNCKCIDCDPYKGSRCSTCVPEMGRDRPKDAWFEARRVGETTVQLFCYDCVELFAVGRTVRKL